MEKEGYRRGYYVRKVICEDIFKRKYGANYSVILDKIHENLLKILVILEQERKRFKHNYDINAVLDKLQKDYETHVSYHQYKIPEQFYLFLSEFTQKPNFSPIDCIILGIIKYLLYKTTHEIDIPRLNNIKFKKYLKQFREVISFTEDEIDEEKKKIDIKKMEGEKESKFEDKSLLKKS